MPFWKIDQQISSDMRQASRYLWLPFGSVMILSGWPVRASQRAEIGPRRAAMDSGSPTSQSFTSWNVQDQPVRIIVRASSGEIWR